MALVASSLLLAGCQNEGVNVEGSRDAAQRWVSTMLPEYELVSFSSATLDTDDDGYVTAEITVRRKGTKGPLRLIQLECPTQGVMRLQRGGNAKLRKIPYNNEF